MKNYGTIRESYETTFVLVSPLTPDGKRCLSLAECMSPSELTEGRNILDYLREHIKMPGKRSCIRSTESYIHSVCNPNGICNPTGGTDMDIEGVWIKKTGEVFIQGTGVRKASDENRFSGAPIVSVIIKIFREDLDSYISQVGEDFDGDYSAREIQHEQYDIPTDIA